MKTILLTLIFLTSIYASTLNLSISSSPIRINPILANDSASSEIANWLFNGLFKYDKDGNIVNDLAHDYKFEDNTTLKITLKQNVTWHNGDKFNADDVIFTYNQIINPKIFTSIGASFKKVKSVEKIDEYTILIKYNEPYFKALEIWMVGMLPSNVLKDEKDLMTSSFNKHPIGTGSYILKEFKNSSDIELYANKDYFEGQPKIEKIVYKFLPDPNTDFLMLKQNMIDVSGLTPLQVDRQIDDKFKNDYKIIETQSFSYTYLGFNLKNPKFENKKIREAISLAINKDELVDILFFGHGVTCEGPFLPGTKSFNENVKQSSNNIGKAKEILKELGYDEKHPFEFETVTNTGNDIRINAAQILQYQLAKANINMKIKVMEWQAFLNTVVHPKNFESVILGWGLSLTPDAYSIWHSKSATLGGFNFISYSNNEVDSLIEQADITIDKEKFNEIYKKIYELISLDYPYIFLYIPNSITVVNNKISPIQPALTGIMHNQLEWIKEDK